MRSSKLANESRGSVTGAMIEGVMTGGFFSMGAGREGVMGGGREGTSLMEDTLDMRSSIS